MRFLLKQKNNEALHKNTAQNYLSARNQALIAQDCYHSDQENRDRREEAHNEKPESIAEGITHAQFFAGGVFRHYPADKDSDKECTEENQVIHHEKIDDAEDGRTFEHWDEI